MSYLCNIKVEHNITVVKINNQSYTNVFISIITIVVYSYLPTYSIIKCFHSLKIVVK